MIPTQAQTQRSEQVKITTYGKEVWSVAQQKMSKFKPHTTMKSLDGGTNKLFVREHKRSFEKKAGGIVATPYKKHRLSRRALFSQSYHTALAADKDDLVDNQIDIQGSARRQDENAAARICDQVILAAIIEPAYESGDATDTLRGSGLLTATVDLNKKHKANAWCKGTGAAGAISALTADDLEDIAYIFSQRDIEDKLVCTLTPELQRILRKDADFKNRENVYSTDRSGQDARQTIDYKNIDFVKCSKDVLPLLSTANIGVTDAANASVGVDVHVRDIADAENYRAGVGDALINSKARLKAAVDIEGNALGGKAAVVTVKSSDMIYFWVPSSLFFASRDDLNFTAMADLQAASFAKSLYMRINFGATLIDDDFSLAYALKGTVKTPLAA